MIVFIVLQAYETILSHQCLTGVKNATLANLKLFFFFGTTLLDDIFSIEHRQCYPANVCVQSKDHECRVLTLTECIRELFKRLTDLSKLIRTDMVTSSAYNGERCSAFMSQLGRCLVEKTEKKNFF